MEARAVKPLKPAPIELNSLNSKFKEMSILSRNSRHHRKRSSSEDNKKMMSLL